MNAQQSFAVESAIVNVLIFLCQVCKLNSFFQELLLVVKTLQTDALHSTCCVKNRILSLGFAMQCSCGLFSEVLNKLTEN